MANYISKHLRDAGVKAPYEDMTTAQIGEQNKANPLASYGFMTAQQKQARQQQQAMYEKQMQQEQAMMQQQLIARMSSQEKIGHYTGSGLMGLMQYLKNRGSAPEVPSQPAAPQDDPQLARYNELAMEVGPEMAMQMLGQEQGNAAMIAQAQQMRAAKDEAALEARYKNTQIQNMESQITDRAKSEVKPNEVITVQRTIDGKPAQVSMEVVGKGPDGRNIYREMGSAVKGSVTDTKEGWETPKGKIASDTKAMEGALASTANALDIYDKLEKLATNTPAGLGWTGKLASTADQAVSGIKNLAEAVARADNREVTASFDVSKYNFKGLDKVAGASDRIKSLTLQLAYAQAAATGDSSRSLSDRDIQNQLDAIGGQITNPQNFLALIKQNKELLVGKLENMAKYTRINGQSIYEPYSQDIEGLKQRAGVGAAPSQGIAEGGNTNDPGYKRLLELRAKYGRGPQ